MSTTVKPVRKFPPPCWTRDEALVLIEAYRERWYALHRAFLRNPDWDAVAEKVTTSCPDVTPPKTSAQCRHKMEKLRQRHRAEKQRASSFPGGRFFSSWFYYEAMEAMENGPNYEPGNNNSNNNNNQEINNTHVSDLNPGRGIRFKPSSNVQNLVTLAASPNFDHKVSNHNNNNNNNSLYLKNWGNSNSNQEENEEIEDGYFVDPTINNKKSYKNSNYPSGVRIKPVILEPVPRKFSKVVNHDHEVDEDGQMWVKVPRNHNGINQNENSWNPNGNQGNERKKRGNGDGIHEVVSSIKLLGDGFMKMEKMKIDMAREIERMRMETEMKRNQLILDSQKQIVDAFMKGLIENRKQTKLETMADS